MPTEETPRAFYKGAEVMRNMNTNIARQTNWASFDGGETWVLVTWEYIIGSDLSDISNWTFIG